MVRDGASSFVFPLMILQPLGGLGEQHQDFPVILLGQGGIYAPLVLGTCPGRFVDRMKPVARMTGGLGQLGAYRQAAPGIAGDARGPRYV